MRADAIGALFAFDLRRLVRSAARSSVAMVILCGLFVALRPSSAATWLSFPTLLVGLVMLALPLRGTVDRTDGTLALLQALPISRLEAGLARALALATIQLLGTALAGVCTYAVLRTFAQPVTTAAVIYLTLAVFCIGYPVSLVLNALYSMANPKIGILMVGLSFAAAVPLQARLRLLDWRALLLPMPDAPWYGPGAILGLWIAAAALVAIGVGSIGWAVQPRGRPRVPVPLTEHTSDRS